MVIALILAVLIWFVDIKPLLNKKKKKDAIVIGVAGAIAVISVFLYKSRIEVANPITLIIALFKDVLHLHY